MAYRFALSQAGYDPPRLVEFPMVELWKYPFAEYAACAADLAKFSRGIDPGGEQRLREFVNKYSATTNSPVFVVDARDLARAGTTPADSTDGIGKLVTKEEPRSLWHDYLSSDPVAACPVLRSTPRQREES